MSDLCHIVNAKLTYLLPEDRISIKDFDLLNVVGKGSFGKVMQVRKKDNGKIYAMKVLNKQTILDRGELAHTKYVTLPAAHHTAWSFAYLVLFIEPKRIFCRSWCTHS